MKSVTKKIFNSSEQVLVVEDSKMFSTLIKKTLQDRLGCGVTVFDNFSETRRHLEKNECTYFAALLDLHLPDAHYNEVIDYVIGKDIPSVVFTGDLSEDVRKLVWEKHIVDYVYKENQDSVNQVVDIINRMKKNIGLKLVVADDSVTTCKLLANLLEPWNFTVLTARNGKEAFDLILQNDDVAILLTDYYMPVMNGLELISKVRSIIPKARLPIIGMSAQEDPLNSAYFLKAGANDYISKPFLAEELYCRLINNIENIEYIATIKNMAEHDFLTGIYNRRSFFNYAEKMFADMEKGHLCLSIAMLDIDNFKHCNDTYGHDAGDEIIRFVAESIFNKFTAGEVVGRLGGEEFCIACLNMGAKEIAQTFEELREEIAQSVIDFDEYQIRVSVSIGICPFPKESLRDMITTADKMMYEAKNTGKNKVCIA